MTVLMVTGNAAQIPTSLLMPVRTLTATIAAELGEAPQGGIHYQALFAIGIVLFLMTFVINLVADIVAARYRQAD
jgi:phosphate transport system permease protein